LLGSSATAQSRKDQSVAVHANTGDVTSSQLIRIGERFEDWKSSNQVLAKHVSLQAVQKLDIDQILAFDRLYSRTPNLHIDWDYEQGLPISMTGNPLQRSRSTFTGDGQLHDRTVQAFLTNFAPLLKLQGEADVFVLSSTQRDERGRTHMRYCQERDGIPVWGGEIVCGLNSAGDLDYFAGRYVPSTRTTEAAFLRTKDEALDAAKAHLARQGVSFIDATGISPLLPRRENSAAKQYLSLSGNLLPVYVVELRPNAIDHWRCFIHAGDGSVVRAYNSTCADGPEKATAKNLHGQDVSIDTYLHQGSYYMIDASRAMFNPSASVFPDKPTGAIVTLTANNTDVANVTHVSSTNNTWNDAAAVSAHANLGVVYEYYRSVHSRNAIDNKGSTIFAIVNVTQGGRSMENAYWNGQFMAFGNGGTVFEPLAKALDVTAHELTHGVTEYSAGLEYINQSGALNEAFSDIFAAMVDRDDWLMGEDVTKTSSDFPTGALRDMSDPHNGGTNGSASWQPSHMNEFVTLPESVDNGGVHINGGIINRAAYLLSENIGRDKAEQIFYNALTTKLTRQSQFIDFRLAIIRAAQELYGAAEATACGSACDQVGITDGKPTVDPPPYSPVDGDDRMLFVNTDPFLPAPLWIVTPPGGTNDFTSVSFTDVWSRPSVSDDGTVAVFVDTEYNIRAIALDGPPNEQVLDNSEVWNSIAISRDQNLLAVTTILLNPEIYVLDISGSTPVARAFDVYTPKYTEDDIPNTAQFPDAVEFSLDNTSLLFDTYNEIRVGTFRLGFWDINLMDVWQPAASDFGTGRIDRIFPQDPEISIGNPTFAKTRQTVIAFDVLFPSDGTAFIMSMDLLQGDPVVVGESTFNQNGYPSYNGDDSILSFVKITQGQSVVYNTPLAADALTPTAAPTPFVIAATGPVWFRTGTRPVAVETPISVASTPVLGQNYPNPFNPSTTIPFSIPRTGQLRLTVHDALGRLVCVLADGLYTAGSHALTWDGRDSRGVMLTSGTYFTRLVVDGSVFTKQMLYLK
jgi:Zn-dependent metalloprotease